MIDPRFYKNYGPFLLRDLVAQIRAEVAVPYNESMVIEDVAPLKQASVHHIAYCESRKHSSDLLVSHAGACILPKELLELVPPSVVPLVSSQPRRDFAQLTRLFYPEVGFEPTQASTARIHPTAEIGADSFIGDFVVVEEGVVVGARCYIGDHAKVGANVQLGDGCRIEPFVHIQCALIGKHVTIKAGAKIGQRGFGFEMDETGPIDIPQLGRVIIEDNVEIGANTTIDRGTSEDTVIGAGSRIDNLVQIAHNVKIGKNCILIAQVGIAGSTELGDSVIMAGQAGVAGHLKIGNRVRVAAQAGLMRNAVSGEILAGSPAVAVRDWHRQTILLQRLIRKQEK